MKKLIDGIRQFQSEPFRSRKSLFKQLAKGQNPLALFITCSDSRIDPNLLTDTGPGDLFVIRNAGNIVPPYGLVHGAEAATIEYAVNVLQIKDIIICGHSHCGAMAGKLAPECLQQLPAVRYWLSHSEDSRNAVPEDYGHISVEPDPLTIAVEKNIFVQLQHLRSHPSVSAALTRKELNLHGWVYQFETGQVFFYNTGENRFLPIETTV
jgi:carbonic anhydrase